MIKFLLLIFTASICATSAMDESTNAKQNHIHDQPLQSTEPLVSLSDLWKRSLNGEDSKAQAEAQYQLFCIYRDGLYGQEKNPTVAIQSGLKARNRPSPYPCIIEELPKYLWSLYLKEASVHSPLALSYLIQGANVHPYDQLCVKQNIQGYINYRGLKNFKEQTGCEVQTNKEIIRDAKNFKKQTGCLEGKDKEITKDDHKEIIKDVHTEIIKKGPEGTIKASLTYKSSICPEYLESDDLDNYLESLLFRVNSIFPSTSQEELRINHLEKIKLLIELISLKDDNTPYLYMFYRKIMTLCLSREIISGFWNRFKGDGLVLLSKLGQKFGEDAKDWPKAYSKSIPAIVLDKIRRIRSQILEFLRKQYYLPAFVDIADFYIEDQKYDQALEVYCQLLTHVPSTRDGINGIARLLSLMEEKKIEIPQKPFEALNLAMKYIIASPSNILKNGAYGTRIFLYQNKLITSDPEESIIDLYLAQLKDDENNVFILAGIADAYQASLDFDNAYKYYILAAQTGELATPMICVANMLLSNMAHMSEFPEMDALEWYKKAANTGNPFAIKLLRIMESMITKKNSAGKTPNLDAWSIDHHLPQPKKNIISKKPKKLQRTKQQSVIHENLKSASKIIEDIPETIDDQIPEIADDHHEIEALAKEMKPVTQPIEPVEKDAESILQEELEQYKINEYPVIKKTPKTLREQIRKMAMLLQLQKDGDRQNNQNKLVFGKFEYDVLCGIFNLEKPNISDKDFIKFATCTALNGIIKVFKTKSGYALAAKTGHIAEESGEGLTAGTHWNHGGKRDGLDWNFVAHVRIIFERLGITPNTVQLG